jgi:hypothetical protein
MAAAQAPLSAIDWLDQNSTTQSGGPVLMEPPITTTAVGPQVEVSPLEQQAAPIGLVPADVTGLPANLWDGSDTAVLTRLIGRVPVRDRPAMQMLLYTLLLSETRPPASASDAETLLLARIDRLMELGATEAALELVQQAGAAANAARFDRWFDAALLTGDEDRPCATLAAAPHLAPDYAARIFCAVRRGDWQTGALTLEAAHALELLPQDMLDLLDRFLSPDVFEDAPPLPEPANPDPLTFRLFEAIGERLPTASLPRAFATADLRDVAGWKAQLEAAERLTRISALSPNRLLGLYTERLPAASGGIWDRVEAVQRFETALNTRSDAAVTKTLPGVWAAMREAGLEVPFSALFADRLAQQPLNDPTVAGLAWRIRLLSPAYESAAATAPDDSATTRFLVALAHGAPQSVPAPSAKARSIADGFDPATPLSPPIRDALEAGHLGEAILRIIAQYESGARGNPADLSGAIAGLRRVGLEDIARIGALQLMLLDTP